MKVLTLTDKPGNLCNGEIYCGNDLVSISVAHDQGKYLFDWLDESDYLTINSAAYETAKTWDNELTIDTLIHDGHNFARIVENIFFIQILRGINEKMAVICKILDNIKPNVVVVNLESKVFADVVEIIAKNRHVKFKSAFLSVHGKKSGGIIKEFFGRYLLPRLLKFVQPNTNKLHRSNLLFAFSQNHFRAIRSLVDNTSLSTFVIGSIVGTKLKSFESGNSRQFCIDTMINLDIWKMYVQNRRAIHKTFTNSVVINDLQRKFTYLQISYFDAIQSDFIDFMATYIPNAMRYYELSTRLFIQFNPESIIFGNDACHRARAAITAGRKLAVPSLVIQHGIIASKELYYPYADKMTVWGKHSLDVLVENGINEGKVEITGTTIFERPIALPVSTTHSSRITIVTSPSPSGFSRSSIGDYIDIIKSLMSLKQELQITVKIHPIENGDNYRQIFNVMGISAIVLESCDLDELISDSAVVITSYSTVAIQAVLLNTPVVCFSSVFPEDTRLNKVNFFFHAKSSDDVAKITDGICTGKLNSKIDFEEREAFLNRYATFTGEEVTKKTKTIITGLTKHLKTDIN
jgi:hypothetical protein